MSENKKKIFSLALAAALTLVIVVIWYSFGDKKTNQVAGEEVESKLSSISPVQMIKDEFSKALSGFNASVADIDSSTTSIPIEIIESTSTASTTI